MFSTADRSEKGRAFIVDTWLLKENARYSIFEPSAICFFFFFGGGRGGGGGRREDGFFLLLLSLR